MVQKYLILSIALPLSVDYSRWNACLPPVLSSLKFSAGTCRAFGLPIKRSYNLVALLMLTSVPPARVGVTGTVIEEAYGLAYNGTWCPPAWPVGHCPVPAGCPSCPVSRT